MVYSYLPYAITEIFCIVFAAAILFRLNSSIGSEHEVAQMKHMVYAYLGMLITDAIWALAEDGLIALHPFVNAVVNAISIICISLGCYFWFRYVDDRLHQETAPNRRYDIIAAIPLIVICSLDIISIFTGWIFIIDENNHYQSSDTLFIIPTTINFMYLLIPTIKAIGLAGKAKSKSQRNEYLSYLAYMIIPFACGVFEDTMPNVPLLALCIFMVILIFFLTIQSRQISTDALTGLNNRRWLNQFLEKKLPTAAADNPVILFMMDVNDFKSINDSFGHIEGDNALKSFATALRLTAARYNAFIARYGGDEFCLVTDMPHSDPVEIEQNIIDTLDTVRSTIAQTAMPYTLSVSIGCAVCDRPESRVEAFIARADDVLYENKQNWHRGKDLKSA